MDDMMKRIIDTDKKAQKIIETAQKELIESENTIIENASKQRDEILSRARSRNIKNKELENDFLEQEWIKKKADYERQIKRMYELAEKRGDEWVGTIVSRVLEH